MNFQMHDLDKTKLPTKRNVVEYALFLQQDSKIKRSAFTEKVFEEVSKLWRYAKIPIVSRTYNRKLITDLLMESSFQTKNPRMFHANDWDTLFRISRCKCSIENDFPCVCADEHKIPENVKGFFIDQCGARLRLLPDAGDDDVSASVFTTDTGATAACSATEYAPTPDSEEDYEFENSQLEDADTPMVAVQLKVSDIRLRYFSSALDRSDTSNRHGALHASMLIKDLQDAIATKESVSADVREQMLKILEDIVINKNKVFRERQKFRKEAKTAAQCHELLTCISFDGKKERTLKTCNVIEIEEHITILKEPNSKFIGYATPSEGSARGIQTAIVDFLQKNNYNLDNLVAISCDGTVTNTGYKGGAITYLESYLRRPLQWFICLFHFNELPFTALLRTWLGKQKGPGLWPGDIGVGINCCMDFPKIILKNNSKSSENWMNPSSKYDTLLKVHIFNYTNIEKYLSGEDNKIKITDVGPLTYKEHTQKVNVSFNKNYTVTFRDHRTYQFLEDKSPFGQFDKFLVPNVPLLTASAKVEAMHGLQKFAAFQIINRFNEPVFKSVSAFDFLWGYRDKIVSLDFETGSTHFGLLMNRNGTSQDSLQINTGEDDIRKFSKINQFNGQPLMTFWSDEQCNRIDGSDATMFPPHLLKSRDQLFVFLQVLCRKIPLQFEKEVTIYNSIKVVRYRTPTNVFASPDDNPENQCYCQNTKKCMPNGVINATKCYNGAPIFPSFPHFFSGDKQLYMDFEGISPEKSKHQTYADIHPRFAFPVSGASRIQINIAVQKGALIKGKLNRLKEGTILPLIWIEITSGDYTDDIIDKLYRSTFGLDTIQIALEYTTLLTSITSFSLVVGGFFLLSKIK